MSEPRSPNPIPAILADGLRDTDPSTVHASEMADVGHPECAFIMLRFESATEATAAVDAINRLCLQARARPAQSCA